MDEEIMKDIIEQVLLNDNKKIDDKCSFEEYLKSFNVKQLTLSSVIHVFDSNDFEKVLEIKDMANKDKKYAIDFILKNIEDIIRTYIKILPNNLFNQLRKLSNTDGILSYNVYRSDYNLQFLEFLKKGILSKVYYNKKDNIVNIYMPTKIKNIIKDLLKDKNLIKENKKYNKVYKFTANCIDTYGILTIQELYILSVKFKLGVHLEELNNILNSYMFVDDLFYIFKTNNTILVANMEFDTEDDALKFYENCIGELNFNLTLKDLKEIGNCQYIHKLKSYKKLMQYLDERYEDIKEDHEYFDEMVIMDYIYSAQTNIKTANKNFNAKIDKILELDEEEKEILRKMLENIFLEYPKWKNKGNI